MNFLKPILIGSFAFFALGLNAQTSGTNAVIAQYSQSSINNLASELSLSVDQVTQIENLNEMVIAKIEAIENNSQMDDAKKREFIRGNREDHKRVMATILTPEQFTAYEEMMKAKASDRTEQRKQMQDIKKTN
jgi:chemotaxis signal transduction protein